MTVVETTIRFAHRGEEIKRLCKKNDKNNLARTITQIRELVLDEALTHEERCRGAEELTARAYW